MKILPRSRLKSLQKMLLLTALGMLLGIPQAGCASEKASQTMPPAEPMQEKFVQMDTNKDGKVVLEEFRAAFPNMNEKAFMVIDTNGNNGIEQAEWFEFVENHGKSPMQPARKRGAPMNNIPGDPLIPPPDSNDLPLVRPPMN